LHFPDPDASIAELNAFRSPAHRRLIFEGVLSLPLGIVLRKRRADSERKARPVVVTDGTREAVRRNPALQADRRSEDRHQGNRHRYAAAAADEPSAAGGRGIGQTIVALMAALVAMENGLQVASLAPTEILAEQHFFNIRRLLESVPVPHELLTGGTPARTRREALAELAGGSLQMVIGTHALVQEDVAFRELGLANHRRAAPLRRAAARDAAGQRPSPDVLVIDGYAHPAHPRADHLRRSRRVGDARDAAGPSADRDDARPESRRDEIYAFVRQGD